MSARIPYATMRANAERTVEAAKRHARATTDYTGRAHAVLVDLQGRSYVRALSVPQSERAQIVAVFYPAKA
jgi:hypothetical protein